LLAGNLGGAGGVCLPSSPGLRYSLYGGYWSVNHWHKSPAGNGSRHPVYACPKESEFTIERHGRIEPVRIDDFDELDVFGAFVT
jgi:hypothetical protein